MVHRADGLTSVDSRTCVLVPRFGGPRVPPVALRRNRKAAYWIEDTLGRQVSE